MSDARLDRFLDRIAGQFPVAAARDDDLPEVASLFHAEWGGDERGDALVARFRRRFAKNPLVRDDEALLVCRRDGAVVGFTGMLDTEVWADGVGRPAGFCIDMVVAPPVRGLGVAAILQRRSNARASMVLEGNLNADARKLAEGLGARPITGGVVRRRWARPWDLAGGVGALTRVRAPGPEFDELWERVRVDGVLRMRRDRAVVAWRYQEHPRHDFHLLAHRSAGRLAGWAALLFRTLLGPVRKAVLVDFLGEVPFAAVAAYAARRGAVLVDGAATEPAAVAALEAAGFRPKTGHDPGFLLYETDETRGDPALWQAARWHLTFGDSDFYL